MCVCVCVCVMTDPLFVNEGVDLWDGDDLGHETAQPLWFQEIELTQVTLHIRVVEQHPRLMEESDRLCV